MAESKMAARSTSLPNGDSSAGTWGDPLDALLIAYETQENLGVRSLMAVLKEAGISSRIEPFTPGEDARVLDAARRYRPRLVGFSIIFQYTIEDFHRLAAHLRQVGVKAHFTAGGHFPSLKPAEVMELIPALDSVVRFEGEYTLLELIQRLEAPQGWGKILGLAYRQDGRCQVNPPRPLIADLDRLPPLVRDEPRRLSRGVRTASIIASRGCLYDCAFCSIRQFYQGAPGPLRRTRSPQSVVAEMVDLYERDGVRFFNFQDDDFAAKTGEQRRWLNRFLEELVAAGLSERTIWKIACRVDDVEVELMRRCQQHGLAGVYLGVESGNETGLRALNKHVSVAQNAAAIQILKDLGLSFEIGYMLFDPSSTVATVNENIAFLRRMMSDGRAPINFCKMLPYGGTPIEVQLRQEGRLRGTVSQPDYAFHDPRLDLYAHFVHQAFQKRNFKYSGLVERLRAALFDVVLARFAAQPGGDVSWLDDYQKALRQLTRQVNQTALETLQAGLDYVAERDFFEVMNGWGYLKELMEWELSQETRFEARLTKILSRYSPELADPELLAIAAREREPTGREEAALPGRSRWYI
jgi:radical SAM superfamily enzyme YgiQ (UPF0313 family)